MLQNHSLQPGLRNSGWSLTLAREKRTWYDLRTSQKHLEVTSREERGQIQVLRDLLPIAVSPFLLVSLALFNTFVYGHSK